MRWVAVVIVGVIWVSAASADNLQARLASEAPNGWQRWETYLSEVVVEGINHKTIRNKNGIKSDPAIFVNYAARVGKERVTTRTDAAAPGGGATTVLNGEEAFRVSRKGKDAPYVFKGALNDLGRARDVSGSFGRYFVTAPCRISDGPVRDWLAKKEIRTTKVESVNSGGKPLAKVAFEFIQGSSAKSDFRSGWILFDPALDWAILEYDLQMRWGRSTRSVVYGEPMDGLRRLVSVTDKDIGQDSEVEYHFEFKTFERRALPDSEFTLAAFNLGQLSQPPAPNRISLGWLLAIGGVIVLIVAAAIARRRLR